MYKALIVDDEKIIRIALKSMIDWEKEGFSADLVAENGSDALELVKKHQPDLIIVDIIMPGMNGIEFVKAARNSGCDAEIVILSNYQEFGYAVDALRNRVSDYIMKTDITPETLTQCLAKIRRTLDSRPSRRSAPSEEPQGNSDVVLLRKALRASLSGKEAEDAALSRPYLFLDVFVRRRLIGTGSGNNMSNHALKNLVMEHVKDLDCFVLQCTESSVLVVIPQPISDGDSLLSPLADKLQQTIRLYMNTDCGFVLSGIFKSCGQFLTLLRSLPDSEQLVLYHDFGYIIPQSKAAIFTNPQLPTRTGQVISRLKQYLDKKDYLGCKAAFDQTLQTFEKGRCHPSAVRKILKKICDFILLYETAWLISAEKRADMLKENFMNSCTLLEYSEAFSDLINLVASSTDLLKVSGTISPHRKEIQMIDTYIRQNINRKITLSMLAENVNMSENYISRLFKAETGVNIVNYINQLKMDRAKSLLESPELSIHDVALSLGFDETPYFNKLFNKFYGLKPTEYRKMLLEILNS